MKIKIKVKTKLYSLQINVFMTAFKNHYYKFVLMFYDFINNL